MLCPICEFPLGEASSFSELPRVTSDCRPWPAGGSLSSCGSCGGIAKPLNAEFLASAASIYAGYAPYAQGAGNEQRVFSESGTSDVRSKRLADFLAGHMRIPSSGTLVDFGCGSGVFIREFLARNPNWSAVGVDSAMHLADAVNAIPRAVFVGRLDEALGRLTVDQRVVVSMIHSLEHVESPRQTLSDISATFPNATLLVQVPDARMNPFDIVVADHRMHFTRDSLDELLGSVFGPQSSRVIEGLVAKELTAVVAPGLGAQMGRGGSALTSRIG